LLGVSFMYQTLFWMGLYYWTTDGAPPSMFVSLSPQYPYVLGLLLPRCVWHRVFHMTNVFVAACPLVPPFKRSCPRALSRFLVTCRSAAHVFSASCVFSENLLPSFVVSERCYVPLPFLLRASSSVSDAISFSMIVTSPFSAFLLPQAPGARPGIRACKTFLFNARAIESLPHHISDLSALPPLAGRPAFRFPIVRAPSFSSPPRSKMGVFSSRFYPPGPSVFFSPHYPAFVASL